MSYVCFKSGRTCQHLISEKYQGRNITLCNALIKNVECPFKYRLETLSFVKKPDNMKPVQGDTKMSANITQDELKEIHKKLDYIAGMVQTMYINSCTKVEETAGIEGERLVLVNQPPVITSGTSSAIMSMTGDS